MNRVRQLPGWTAVDANSLRGNQPGFDLEATHRDGRALKISVKSVSSGGKRHDYGIGRTFARYPADIYAFVDMTTPDRVVYLAGARTVERLALARHKHYQAERGRTDALNSWAPKVSRALLEQIGARECWSILARADAAEWPRVTESMLAKAREDTPKARGTIPR